MEKYKKKPYKHQDFPKMVYHGETGKQLICKTEEEIPEGYVFNLRDVGEKPSKKAKPGGKKTGGKKATGKSVKKGPTLEGLKVSRKEAEEILTDEEVKFDDDMSDNEIAVLLDEVLEDDKSK